MKKVAKIFNLEKIGEPRSKTLPEEVFSAKENKILLARAVKVYLANQRRAKATVKRRSEVSGSGKKIWRQKGTGRARHGDRYANIFVGGGAAHSPTGKENWHLNLPVKAKTAALAISLTEKFKKGEIVFIDSFEKLEKKTNQANQQIMALLEKTTGGKNFSRIGLVFFQKNSQASLALRNISAMNFLLADSLNAYEVLKYNLLIVEEKALEKLDQRIKHD